MNFDMEFGMCACTGMAAPVATGTGQLDDTPHAPIVPGRIPVAQVLDLFAYGVMVVSQTGKLTFANRAALRACTFSTGLQLAEGHVRPTDAHERCEFERALRLAAEGRRSMLTLRRGRPRLTIATLPLDDGGIVADEPAVLLAFGRDAICEPLNEVFFAREYGLTSAECTVLTALCTGLRPSDVAAHCGVAISTIRTQICSLRHKTGATHITDLVRMMTGLPPILPVHV